MTEQGRVLPEMGITEEMFGDRQGETPLKAEMAARVMDWRGLTNSLILCHFADPPGGSLLKLINSVTGWGWDWPELRRTAERIYTFKRLLNFRFGMTRGDERLPKPVLQPIFEGNTGGYVPDVEKLLAFTYQVRGYDLMTGIPTPDKLIELGLSDVVIGR
jgi:aldehyde:ferredoxin oxidoreductase